MKSSLNLDSWKEFCRRGQAGQAAGRCAFTDAKVAAIAARILRAQPRISDRDLRSAIRRESGHDRKTIAASIERQKKSGSWPASCTTASVGSGPSGSTHSTETAR